MDRKPLPVIELAWLTDAEMATARTGANVAISGLQAALDAEYPKSAYADLNAWSDAPNKKALWTVKADAVRARADTVFGPYGGGWKDEVEVLSMTTDTRPNPNNTEKTLTWYVIDIRYRFFYLIKWMDDTDTEQRAWVALPDLYDSDEMMGRGFVYRAGRSVALKQAIKYLGGFRHITGKFDGSDSGEEEDSLRPGSERSVPVTQTPGVNTLKVGNEHDAGNQHNGQQNSEPAAGAPVQPAATTAAALIPTDQVTVDTPVKDTDLSWLDEVTRKMVLTRCGQFTWGQLSQKVPTTLPLFLVKGKKTTPEAIQTAIKAGQTAGSASPTDAIAANQ